MAYDNIISRSEEQALMPEEVSNAILTNLSAASAAMTLFKHVGMSRKQVRMPVLDVLPIAFFVNGDTGLKQTTEVNWANRFLNAEELACIVPIPEAVLDDADYDTWGTVQPLTEQAIGRALDAAVFFGVNKPSSWPSAIVPEAVTRSHSVARGTNDTAHGGVFGDLSDAYAKVEEDGYDVNGLIARTTWKAKTRNARTTYGEALDESFKAEVDALIKYPMRGLWPDGSAVGELVLGDFDQGLLGVRQDISYKLLTEAVIQDGSGNIVFNLAQQDMVALRVTARFAFETANTITYDNTDAATRYPFAVVTTP